MSDNASYCTYLHAQETLVCRVMWVEMIFLGSRAITNLFILLLSFLKRFRVAENGCSNAAADEKEPNA